MSEFRAFAEREKNTFEAIKIFFHLVLASAFFINESSRWLCLLGVDSHGVECPGLGHEVGQELCGAILPVPKLGFGLKFGIKAMTKDLFQNPKI